MKKQNQSSHHKSSTKRQSSQKISQHNGQQSQEKKRNLSDFLAQIIGQSLQTYQRNIWVSIACLTVYSLQLLSTLFSQHFADDFKKSTTNHSLVYYLYISLQYTKIYPILLMGYSDYRQQLITMIFFASLNGIFLILEFISLVLWFMKDSKQSRRESSSSPSQSQYNIKNKKLYQIIQDSIIQGIQWIVSVVSQIFFYIAWIPSIEVSCHLLLTDSGASTFTKLSCVFVVITSSFLCMQSRFFDNNYSFLNSSDFLAQRKNRSKYIFLIADLFIQIIQSINSILLSGVSHITVSVIRGLFIIQEIPVYLNYEAQKLTLFQTTYYCLSSISMVLATSSSGIEQISHNRTVFLYFLISIFLPLSYKIASKISSFRSPKYDLMCGSQIAGENNDLSSALFIRFIYDLRHLLNLSFEDYIQQNQGIILESLLTNHVSICMKKEQSLDPSLRQACFCWKYRKDPTKLSISEINGMTYRNNFLIDYMSAQYSLFFRIASKAQRENIEILISYVLFLIEIAKTPAKAYAQLLELNALMRQTERNNNNSVWKECDMKLIVERIRKEFTRFFRVSSLQNQRLNLPLVFEFESASKELKVLMKTGLNIREQFFTLLCSDNIQLETLVEHGNKCLDEKKHIEKNILLLFDIHPTHPSTLCLAQIFVEFFDFKKRKLSQFQSHSKYLLKKRLLKSDGKINLFRRNSCAVFVSLSTSQLQIIRASASSVDFFRCAQSTNVLNQPLAVYFPEWTFDKFSEMAGVIEGEGNMDLIKIGEYFTFLRDSFQKVFPVKIRAALGVLSQEEFGLSLLMEKIEKSSLYIVCNSGFQIIQMTPTFPAFLKGVFNISQKKNNNNINTNQNGFKNQNDNRESKQSVNIRWLIPHVFALNQMDIPEINSVSGFEDMQGFRELALQSSKEYNTFLMHPKDSTNIKFPTNQSQEQESNYDNPYDIEKYFEKLKYQNYNYNNISYSIFKISGMQSSDSDVFVLEISRMKQIDRIQEVNELLFQLQKSLKERFPKFSIRLSALDRNSRRINTSQSIKKTQSITGSEYKNDDDGTNTLRDQEEQQRKIYETQWVKETVIEGDEQARNLVAGNSENLKEDEGEENQQTEKINSYHTEEPQSTQIEDQVQVLSIDNPLLSEGPLLISPVNWNLTEIELKDKSPSVNDLKLESKKLSSIKIQKISQNIKISSDNISPSKFQLQKLSSTTLQTTERQTLIQVNLSLETDRQLTSLNRHYESGNTQENYFLNKDQQEQQLRNKQNYQLKDKIPNKSQPKSQQKPGERKNKNIKIIADEDGNLNFSSEHSNSKEAKKLKIGDGSSSINSAQSQFFSKKQSLYDMVVKRKKLKEVIYSRIVGIASLLIILSVTVYLYIVLNSQFQTEKRYYQNLLFGPDLLENYASVMRIMEIKMIIQLGTAYGYLASHFTAADVKNFGLEGSSKLLYLDSLLGSFQIDMVDNGLADYMLKNYTTIYIRDISGLIKIPTSFTRFYSLINVPINMYGYMKFGTKQWRTYIYTNYQSFVSTFGEIQEIQLAGAYTQLDDSKNLLIYSYIIYEISCLCSIVLILPLYYIIQTKREEILKLIVTFSPSFLELMIARHHQAQSMEIFETNIDLLATMEDNNITTKKLLVIAPAIQIRSKMDFKALKLVQQGQQQQTYPALSQTQSRGGYLIPTKKRMVSTVNRLSRSSLKMIFMVTGIFTIISLYSLLNYLFTADFFNYFEYNISELSLISRTKAQLDIDLVSMYLQMNCRPYSFTVPEIQDMLDFHSNQVLPDLVSRIQNFYYLQKNFDGHSRSFISNYEKVINEAITGNACNLLNSSYTSQIDSLEILLSDVTIPTIDCETIQNGALTKGIVFWLKQFQSKFMASNQAFLDTFSKPLTTYFMYLYKWDAENNLRSIEMAYSHVRNILNTLANFMRKKSTDFIEELLFTQLVLFWYSIIVSSVILLYIWRRYVQWMDQSLFQTTILLSLIPIEYSIDNPYILSYLHKEKSRLKGK